MEDFVRKTLEVRDIESLPLNTSKELDMVADRAGRIFIKIKNVYKELLFDNYEEIINELLTRVELLETEDDVIKQQIQELVDYCTQLNDTKANKEEMTVALNDLINRVSNIEGSFTGINIRLSDLETEVMTYPAKFDEINQQITTANSKIDTEINTQVSINATQNTRLNTLETKVVDTTWRDVTMIEPFTASKTIQVKRQNGIVYMRGTLAHNTTNNGVGDCFTLPEGFRPPASGSYEYHYLLPGQSATQTDAAKIYVRPTGVCSIASKSGTTPIFVEPITFSIT
jgi:predicted  nucleic acid-binding Zn-ribbon protein